MRLFRQSRSNIAKVENLEQQVTRLQAMLRTCKNVAQRRSRWLVAVVAANIVLFAFVVVINRKPIEHALTERIPTVGATQAVQGIAAAHDAYQNGDYNTALRLSRPLAEQGNARAQSLLGLIYHNGHGVTRDEREAMKWFRNAAEQGDAVAQLQIGVIYYEGRGVPRNCSDAARWYQRAADQGNAEAQYNLGVLYAIGKGTPQDNVLAYMWFNLAAAHFRTPDTQQRAAGNRDVLAKRMSSEEIARAQELAREWDRKKRNPPGQSDAHTPSLAARVV